MYSFVFLWTMALSPNKEAIKHGLIFVNFMTASMVGSFVASILMKRAKPESYMRVVYGVGALALLVPAVMHLDTSRDPGEGGREVTGGSKCDALRSTYAQQLVCWYCCL